MAEATRGVRFVLKAETDDSVGLAFSAISERAAQLQKMLGDFKLGGLDIGRFQSSLDRAHASLDDLHRRSLTPVDITPFTTSQIATPPAALGSPSPSAAPGPAARGPVGSAEEAEKPARVEPAARPSLDPAAVKTAVERPVDDYLAAQQRMDAASTAGAARRTAANARATKIEADQERELTRQAEAENEKRGALPERVIRVRVTTQLRVQKAEADQEKSQQAAADRESARLQKQADAEQKAAGTRERVAARTADRAIANMNRETAAAAKAADRNAALAAAGTERQKRELGQATEANRKHSQSVVKSGEDSAKKRSEAHERATRRIEELNSGLRKSLAEAAEGTAELAHGFVELGLVSEEDFNRIKNSIRSVQSAMDQVRSAVEIWNSVSEAVHLYQERLKILRGTEDGLLAVERARGAASPVGGAGGVAKAATEGVAGAAGQAAGGLANVGKAIAGAITPVTIGAAAVGAAIYVAAKFALDKWKEASEEGAKRDAEARKREVEIREAQNAALLQLFAAEKRARQQTGAREALALKIDQQFGGKRKEYEASADERKLQGPARDQHIADRAAIDENNRALEEARKELAEVEKQPERSRQASAGEGRLAKPKESEAISAKDQERLDEIAREREHLRRRMYNSERAGMTAATKNILGVRVESQYGADQRRQVELGLEEAELRKKNRPVEGVNQFAADEKAETQAAQEAAAIRQRIAELEAHGAELSREQFRHEVSALNEELQQQQELIEGDKERVKSAADYAKQMHDAVQAGLAGFGHLTKGQQERAIKIKEKLDRGETLSKGELKFAEEHQQALGKKIGRQVQQQYADKADPRAASFFDQEMAEAAKADAKLAEVVAEAREHNKLLGQIKDRIGALNERSAAERGGEKAQVIDAKGHAELTVKWDENSSQLVAKAIQPELAKWQSAIDQMLEKATAEIEQTFKRTIQRKAKASE